MVKGVIKHKDKRTFRRKKQFKKKNNEKEQEQENKADFYLDDVDADLAYDSDELKEDEVERDEDEDLNENEDEEMSEHGSDLDFNDEDYVSSDHDEDKEDENKSKGINIKKKKERIMTKLELKKLIKKVNKGSLYSLTQIVILFGKITNPDNQPETLSPENIFANSKIINKLIEYSIETLPNHLQLKINSKPEQNNGKSSIKELSKKYISIISKYLKICASQMTEFIYSNISSFENLIFLFNSFIEKFLKHSIQIWASHPSSNTRNNCLTFIIRALTQKPTFFEFAIKLFYINYLEIAKAMNLNSYRNIDQMQQDIIALLRLDLQKTYITVFVFIRKLCIQLRATIVEKTSSSIKQIYNWQFVNSLILWTKVVIMYYKSASDINMLAYPLIQTIIGVIRLNYSETFYLLRLRLVGALNDLSKASGIFIPIGIYILPIFSSNYFIEKVKGRGSDSKKIRRLNPFTNLKIKNEDFKSKQIRKDLLEEVCDCLIDFLSINATKICFGDLVYGILKQMRAALKRIYDKEYREIIKRTIEIIESNSVYVKEQIANAKETINITQPNSIAKFESGLLKEGKCELAKQYDNNQRKRRANLEAIEHQKDETFIEV